MADPDLRGLRLLVTGANSGIGKALAERLAAAGADLVLAARSESRTRPVVEALRSRHPAQSLEFLLLDLADFASVRAAAHTALADPRPIDVLVNNAGVAGTNGLSRDGFDLTYAINHLGPFLFTELLLPGLLRSGRPRIVNVASAAHYRVKRLDWSVLDRRRKPKRSGFNDYSVTKLMNVLHARELALRPLQRPLRTCSLHPGAVASNIWRRLPVWLQWFGKKFMLSNEQGAETPFYCATAELEPENGRYYDKCRQVRPSRLAQDDALAAELRTRSEAAIASTGA